MEQIQQVLITITKVIDIIGILILLFGFSKILIKYLFIEFKNIKQTSISSLQLIRCELGIYILLALDFLIASDIIHTITDLSNEQLIALTVMIALRTIIGFFLGKEVNELESEKKSTGK
ncbi:MAG: putative membrane protein [Chitinophagales bacterium]|jgi:uncharacterized membrane protein